jgi:hypothetical protein
MGKETHYHENARKEPAVGNSFGTLMGTLFKQRKCEE